MGKSDLNRLCSVHPCSEQAGSRPCPELPPQPQAAMAIASRSDFAHLIGVPDPYPSLRRKRGPVLCHASLRHCTCTGHCHNPSVGVYLRTEISLVLQAALLLIQDGLFAKMKKERFSPNEHLGKSKKNFQMFKNLFRDR